MHRDETLIREALNRATGATIHGVSGWVAKYRLAVAVGDRDGAVLAEQALRQILSNPSQRPVRPGADA